MSVWKATAFASKRARCVVLELKQNCGLWWWTAHGKTGILQGSAVGRRTMQAAAADAEKWWKEWNGSGPDVATGQFTASKDSRGRKP